MSRSVKYICDGCGKEIKKNPIRLQAEYVDAETGDFSMDAKGYYWENEKKDYCENCITQIIHFVDGLPARNAGKPAVPNPDFEKEMDDLLNTVDSLQKGKVPQIRTPSETSMGLQSV